MHLELWIWNFTLNIILTLCFFLFFLFFLTRCKRRFSSMICSWFLFRFQYKLPNIKGFVWKYFNRICQNLNWRALASTWLSINTFATSYSMLMINARIRLSFLRCCFWVLVSQVLYFFIFLLLILRCWNKIESWSFLSHLNTWSKFNLIMRLNIRI